MNRWIAYLVAAIFPTIAAGFEYTGPTHSVQANRALENFSEQLAAENNLFLLNLSYGDIADAREAPWGLSYTSNEQLTLEEVRPKVAALTKALLYKIHHDPLFLTDYEKCKYSRSPFGSNSIAFKIAFWDQDVDRPLPPYLAQVRFANGQVYYHYADAQTQALLEPIVESLDSLGITPEKYAGTCNNKSFD